MCEPSVNCVKMLFDVLFCFDPRTRTRTRTRTTTTTFLLIGSLRKLAIKKQQQPNMGIIDYVQLWERLDF